MNEKLTAEKVVALLLDNKGKPISLGEMPLITPDLLIQKLRVIKPVFYNTITLSLATARTGVDSEAIDLAGDFFAVQDITGAATAKVMFNELKRDRIDLADHLRISTPFYRFFLINAAQVGESITIIVGRESQFTLEW